MDRTFVCRKCGGTMIGDGFTEPLRCEFAEDAAVAVEPDAGPVYCDAGPNPTNYPDRGAWIDAHPDPADRDRLMAEWIEEEMVNEAEARMDEMRGREE